jgi:chromosome segregation ATPase
MHASYQPNIIAHLEEQLQRQLTENAHLVELMNQRHHLLSKAHIHAKTELIDKLLQELAIKKEQSQQLLQQIKSLNQSLENKKKSFAEIADYQKKSTQLMEEIEELNKNFNEWSHLDKDTNREITSIKNQLKSYPKAALQKTEESLKGADCSYKKLERELEQVKKELEQQEKTNQEQTRLNDDLRTAVKKLDQSYAVLLKKQQSNSEKEKSTKQPQDYLRVRTKPPALKGGVERLVSPNELGNWTESVKKTNYDKLGEGHGLNRADP